MDGREGKKEMEEKEIELQDMIYTALVNSFIKKEKNAFKITSTHYWKMFIDVVRRKRKEVYFNS